MIHEFHVFANLSSSLGTVLPDLMVAIVSSSIGGIALIRSVKRDKVSAAAQNLDEIFDGNQKLVQSLTSDNQDLRRRITAIEKEFAAMKIAMQEKIDEVTEERNELSHKLIKAQRRIAQLERGQA